MKAIILAAGQGRRLRPITNQLPKCLVSVGGAPLLKHMLDRIRRCGFGQVNIVTGFGADLVQRYVSRLPLNGLRVSYVVNERFAETNNLFSLWLALREHDGAAAIFNADDYFNLQILQALLKSSADTAAAVDFTLPLPSDAMRVRVKGQRITFLGKTLSDRFASGNAIGMYHFSARTAALLRDEIDAWVRSGRVKDFYVAAINALASRIPIKAVSTEGLTWGEIDDHIDLAAAPARFAKILAEENCMNVAPIQEQCVAVLQPIVCI